MDDKILGPLNTINRLWIKIVFILIICFVLLINILKLYTINEVNKHATLEEFTVYLDERIPSFMKEYDIPGVNIDIIQKCEITFSKAYGYADIEEGRKMTTDTFCRVESISKSVTAWGIMKLVEQGKIELDKPVKRYIKNWEFPETNFSVENITVKQLLNHTAGMPLGDIFGRYSPYEEIPSLEESLFKQAIPVQEPGISFLYSNTGYNLLELLIEEVTGRDFSEYMEKEILIPLGMYRSSFIWSEKLNPPVPVGYDVKGNPIPVYIYPEKASGGIFAQLDDIANFVISGMSDNMNEDNEVLTSKSINKLYVPIDKKIGVYDLIFDSYGMGYYIETLGNGKKAVANGGQGGGCMTFFQSVPETGDGIVILTNSQRSWPFFGYILSDWAKWCGFESVGFGKIIWAQKILWISISLIWIIMLCRAWKLRQGIVNGRRRFKPLYKKFRSICLVQCILSIILVAILFWCRSQEYLFISSVFPIVSGYLGFSIFVFAMFLLLSALFPYIDD